ncbi:chromosome partitioning protein ParA [Pedobacter sp. PAMC26386]|nr:chromosome partitioning protein ParA [Pedobacter sp. PAMC26386]
MIKPIVTYLINCLIKNILAVCSFFLLISNTVLAQNVVLIDDKIPHYIFSYGEIECLEDRTGVLMLNDILKLSVNSKFLVNEEYNPKNYNMGSAYWYKFKIKHSAASGKNWLLEFFDQSINDFSLFVPDSNGHYHAYHSGTAYPFNRREYQHKNFVYELNNDSNAELTYYIRIKSSQSVSAIIVLRDIHWFVKYALNEYLFFGLFYGMVIVFSLYNLLMFLAVRQIQYLYYVLYNLSIGLYEMSIDGIAFQYLWPNWPLWNAYGIGFTLYLSSVFGLMFTLVFLYSKIKAPKMYRVIIGVIVLRSLFFIACVFNTHLFNYKVIELIPLLVAYGTGIYVWKSGYRPARFFVMGYSFLLIGFLIKILLFFELSWLPYGPFIYYSLSFCFVFEMLLVSFAIGESVRIMKCTLNTDLSPQVDQHMLEVRSKAAIIEKQNEEISSMNAILEKDNYELHLNIEKVTKARVMSHEVDFAEFSKSYPDRETCFKYLSELKWSIGYTCRKCTNKCFLAGFLPYSRRCTKCGYDESVIAHTIFQNSKIPINKAFYMLFLVYSTKGKISSYKLSGLLLIRQSTCWAYNSKMQKILEERKKELKSTGEKGWSKLIITPV